jgi:hypothetical protein
VPYAIVLHPNVAAIPRFTLDRFSQPPTERIGRAIRRW